MTHVIYFDGAITKNPGGNAGYGFVITQNGQILETQCGPCHDADTSNQAEYAALIQGMKSAIRRGLKDVIFRGDTKLIINQMCGNWKVKDSEMRTLWIKAQSFLGNFESVEFEWIEREKNWVADELSKAGKVGGAEITRRYDV